MTLLFRAMPLALLLASGAAAAQEAPMWHPGSLAHALDRVAHTGRVLYVAAHPDDENTRLLAYLSNQRHLTVAYLSLTRGEGGQNLIGSEQGELLGVIRTHELLAARRMDGAIQRFTRMRDFGFSKRPDEALAEWGHDEALHDVVWTIRSFQPDVVITRFDETPPNHGHHTASAILAKEAIAAAADPKQYPEQLQRGVTPWRVERLVHNFSHWRGKPPADALPLDVGAYDVRLGMSYGELAAISRSQHKSQGFGSAGERGVLLEHFVHVAGSKPQKDLLEGIDVGWTRFGANAKPFIDAIAEAQRMLTRDTPESAVPALLKAHRALEALPDGPRKTHARAQLEQVLRGAVGLFVRATSERAAVTPGAKLPVKVEIVMRRPAAMRIVDTNAPLKPNEKQELTRELEIPKDAEVSAPYWLKERSKGGLHTVEDAKRIGDPVGPPPITTRVRFGMGDRTLELIVPVEHVWTDRVQGERVRPVLIVPPATVSPGREAVMLANGKPAKVTLRVRGYRENLAATVRLPLPAGWTARPATQAVKLAAFGDEVTVQLDVTAPAKAAPITLAPEVVVDGEAWSFREDVIDYPHLPMQVVLQPAQLRLSPLTVRLPRGLVGYVEGSGDTVMEDLAHVGVRIEPVDAQTLRSGDLKKYAAIVLGIRAFNTLDVLKAARPRLWKYVEQGGTVIVQYNTTSRWDPLQSELGPFPLSIGRDRVTDQGAEVVAIDPKHPVLTAPNRLSKEDYQGWVQERGLYFAEKWDPKYMPLYRIADPGEKPLEGSVLVAKHGRGRYVYTGLSFFRQLPAGVPGAYRLLANLLEAK